MDNFYVVGDYVKYGDFTGQVISFGLKSTKIKDFNGNVMVVSNRNIDEIINLTVKLGTYPVTIVGINEIFIFIIRLDIKWI